MEKIERQIDIAANALTTCPDRSYGLVSIAARCMACPHSHGLAEVIAGDAAFENKYRVLCGVPQVREIVVADFGGCI